MLPALLSLVPLALGAPAPRDACPKPNGDLTTNPSGPLFPEAFASPGVLMHNGMYYAYATSKGAANIPVASSNDWRTGWSALDNDNVLPNPGNWAVKQPGAQNYGVWAPSVWYMGGKFVMYYGASKTTSDGTDTAHCLGVATADDPLGPFTPTTPDSPFICTEPLQKNNGEIDASPYSYNGKNYLVYKHGGHGDPEGHSHILITQLDDTGTQLVGDPVTVYTSTTADYDAEGPALTVGPDGTCFLWFVTGFFRDPNYTIQYKTGNNIMGPYDGPETVLLETGNDNPDKIYLLSPGNPQFINSTYMMFMSTKPDNAQCTSNSQVRNARVAELVYNGASVQLRASG